MMALLARRRRGTSPSGAFFSAGKKMARIEEARPQAAPEAERRESLTAGIIIGSHSIQHMYHSGFLIIIPYLYTSLGLAPIQVGVMQSVQRLSGGLFSMGGGVVVDRLQHRRGLFLGASLLLMGLGYLLMGVAPNYLVILLALGFASAAGSFWHPPALGILSQRFPERRGLLISLHRASGSAGESLAPILVGLLLVVASWEAVLRGGFFLALVPALLIWTLLWGVGGPRVSQSRSLGAQARDLVRAAKRPGMLALLLLAGIRGMGDNAMFSFLSLYLTQELGMSSWASGIHVSLLIILSIGFGPAWGWLSDRWGRKPVMIAIMAISASLAGLMILADHGPALTLLLVLMGTSMFAVNSLVQAGAMDLAEGLKLEGSLIGVLWGNNALFGAVSPIIVATLAGVYSFKVIFHYAAVMYLIGLGVALALPRLGAKQPAPHLA
jgi:MFS family permease